MKDEEKGFAAIFVLFAISIALLLGAFVLSFAKNETETAKNFFCGLQAQNAAEAGIQEFFAELCNNENVFETMCQAAAGERLILQSAEPPENGSYSVYLSTTNERWVVLSIGEFDGARRQVVAYLTFREGEGFLVRIDNE